MHKGKESSRRLDWYYAPGFLLFWLALFFAVVLPRFLYLPKGLTVDSEKEYQGKFIAERAERILYEFDKIGPKVTGSDANEKITLQLLTDEVEKIRKVVHHDLFDMEVDVQVVSGAYAMNVYQGLQNFIIKLSSKNSTSKNYFLINSHFDSKPGSPGSGDDGAMVVVMLEIIRVLATNRQTFKHPIVFLFNGAEENGLQASHGFITQHKWARNCKSLINLDSAGSGNREIVFQSGPNHSWLMKYYKKHVVRPYASTVAEELFQSNLIPSNTDFYIFRGYGHVPGLDIAHFYNGYVYHTKFDKYDVIPRGTLQATGDNILSLAIAFANAPELEDTEKYSKGHSVFYDFLGLFFVYYTENESKIINTSVCLIVIILIGISLWLMATISYISIGKILKVFSLILILHLIGVVCAIALPLLVAVVFDSGDCAMTWFTSKWLVFGLYVCPSLFGLTLPTLLYLNCKNQKLGTNFEIQLIQHAHAFLMAIICMGATFRGFRSSYLLMIPLFFYGAALIINCITTLYRSENLWYIVIALSQVLPFLYSAYVFLILVSASMPITGRLGSTLNPDLFISASCAVGTILSMGFVMPMLNMFHRSKITLLLFLLITFIFAMIALTSIGFPYRPKTNVGRIHYLNVRRVFYEYDGSVSRNESGYYFSLQDRRLHKIKGTKINLSDKKILGDDCDNYMMCGLPLFGLRMINTFKQGIWLSSKEPTELPATPKLKILKKAFNTTNSTAHFEFELSGPPHMNIYLLPLKGVTIFKWSFLKYLLQDPQKPQGPYLINFLSGIQSTPFKFFFDFQLNNTTIDEPVFELGISGHYINAEYSRGKHAQEFIKYFPEYVFVMEWPSSYERYIF